MVNTMNKINTNNLTPGDVVRVKGRLIYSRLIRKISGEELQRRNQQIKTKYPITVPYNTATVCDAQILCKDPNHPTLLEQWAQEHFFKSKTVNASGYSFTAINKGEANPWIGQWEENGKVNQVYPENELAAGLEVILILNVFKTSQNNGVGLSGVIVKEPIKLYVPNDPTAILGQFGYQFIAHPAPQTVSNNIDVSAASPQVQAAMPVPTNQTTSFATDQSAMNPFQEDNGNEGLRYTPQSRGI